MDYAEICTSNFNIMKTVMITFITAALIIISFCNLVWGELAKKREAQEKTEK